MSGMSAAYAANEDNEAERQARRVRAAGWGPDAIAALRIRAGHERSHREHQARKGE